MHEDAPRTEPTFDPSLTDLPLLRRERLWGFWTFSSVNVGYAIATWAFLQGGAIAYYVGAKQAIASAVIGYGIAILLVALAPCLPSARYGLEQYVSLRSTFGDRGAQLLMLIVAALIATAWSAVLAIMCGHAVANASNELLGTHISYGSSVISAIALTIVILSWLFLSRGPVSIEWVNRFVAPGLIVITLVMLCLIFSRMSWSELSTEPAIAPETSAWLSFMLAVELNIAGGFAWWPNMGNLARLTRSSRIAFWPNFLGIYLASVLAAVVGSFAALSLGTSDPTMWMLPLGGAVLGVLALGFVGFANITAILATGYSSMVALRGGGGTLLRDVKWPVLAACILSPAVVMVLFPGVVYDNYGRFVSWTAVVVAPLCGIQIVDFFVLRRQRISLRDSYDFSPQSAYRFWGGFNIASLASLAMGALTYALLLNPVSYVSAGMFRYTGASIPAFCVAALMHYLLTRFVVIPRGMGGYVATTAVAGRLGSVPARQAAGPDLPA